MSFAATRACSSLAGIMENRKPAASFLLEQHLEFVRRGVDLIECTRHQDDRRVMLGFLFRDLDALRMFLSVASPETKTAIRSLERQAYHLREREGGPVEPDAPESRETKDEPPCRGDAPALWTRPGFPCGEPGGSGTPSPRVHGLRAAREAGDAAGISPARGRGAEPAADPPPGEPAGLRPGRRSSPRGPRFLQFRMTHPETEIWILAGLIPRAAKALVEAGIRSPEDLRKRFREEVLALRGLGVEQLKRCERILGQQLPTRTADYWTANGVHYNTAKALIKAGLHSIEDIEGMTREQLLFISGVGEITIRHLERLRGGRPVPSYEDHWRKQGFDPKSAIRLSRAGICNLDELRRKSPAELRRIRLTEQEISTWLG